MKKKIYEYIYGPVASWRLGYSLGIDLLSQKKKVCSFDCIYCQLGEGKIESVKRKTYVSTKKIIKELENLPKMKIDYITFSGRGEPTLAKNLGKTITAVKSIRKEPIAVLTNSALLQDSDVRKELVLADRVMAKLDVCSQGLFKKINQPAKNLSWHKILKGLKQFRREYKGIFALQIMFVNKNKKFAEKIAGLATKIQPDEIQINTPLRPCKCKPLSKKEIKKIERFFSCFKVSSVYKGRNKKVNPISEADTLRRRSSGSRGNPH